MLVAIFVVPVALSHFGKKESMSDSKQLQLSACWLKPAYWLTHTRTRAKTAAAVFMVSILGLAYLLMPAAEYLPEGEEPKAFSMMIAPPSYNLSEMKKNW
jgi:multidrug efflux pump subunit AcrB